MICAAVALILAADIAAMPLLQPILGPLTPLFVNDVLLYLAAGVVGLYCASRLGSPHWWRPGTDSDSQAQQTLLTLLLGVAVVAANTFITVVYRDQAVQAAPWITLLTPRTALALSFRAALTEEIFFRLFLFPLIAVILLYFLHSKEISLIIGAFVSSLVFGLLHLPSGFFLAFFVGLALVYIYYQRGLVPAMVVHFFADAIPFVILSVIL